MQVRRLAMLAFSVVLLWSPAFAGPREDTFAGISRCSSIADNRLMLECIYGAAQPLRSSLGLPPASAFQISLVPPAAGSVQTLPVRPVPQANAAILPTQPIPPKTRAPAQPAAKKSGGWFNNIHMGDAVDK